MRKYLLPILIFFLPQIIFGQISVIKFLKSFQKEEAVEFQKQKLYFLSTLSHDLPLIEKLEVRTESNEFDFLKQEYVIRVTPNSIKNIKTQRQYQRTIRNRTEMELQANYSTALRKRYDLLINYIFLKRILAAKKSQSILFKDKATLLKRSITLADFDVLELIDAEDEVQENLQEILDLENAISTYQKNIQRISKSESIIKISDDNIITIETIKKLLNTIPPDESVKHPQLEVLSAKKYSNILAYEWEAAKSKFSIGYIQAKYGYNPNDDFIKSFSLGLGFDIPLKSTTRLDLNELQITIHESESEYRETKNQLIEKKYATYHQLQNMIRKYELVLKFLESSQAEFALQEYSKIAGASPKAMLKLRENTLKKELLLEETRLHIIRNFIEYLDYTGLLIQQPLTNYLSKNLDGLLGN